ncbi:hypothetical protein L3V83_06370 [Thiotrichales bacterium 19X7-9]|nr:hypothetical protein [Thiotrichales bacterium 19X7-9]
MFKKNISKNKFTPSLNLYFGGTKENLSKNFLPGILFKEDDANNIKFDEKNNLVGFEDNKGIDFRKNKDFKIYFLGPSANADEYNGIAYSVPGENYNVSNNSAFSNHQSNQFSRVGGASGSGWRHNLQQAIALTRDFVMAAKEAGCPKVNINIPASFSRGGITAIAVSNSISKHLKELGVSSDFVDMNVTLIDPVAGGKYGNVKKAISRSDVTDNLETINPIYIGEFVNNLKIIYSTKDERSTFRPQLPVGLDKTIKSGKDIDLKYHNNRPLLIPDKVNTTVIYLNTTHTGLASPSKSSKSAEVYQYITGKQLDASKFKIASDDKSQDVNSWKERMIGGGKHKRVCSEENILEEQNHINYRNSALYDAVTYLKNRDLCDPYNALKDSKHEWHGFIKWAYENSNFYNETKLDFSKVERGLFDKISQIQDKIDLKLKVQEVQGKVNNIEILLKGHDSEFKNACLSLYYQGFDIKKYWDNLTKSEKTASRQYLFDIQDLEKNNALSAPNLDYISKFLGENYEVSESLQELHDKELSNIIKIEKSLSKLNEKANEHKLRYTTERDDLNTSEIRREQLNQKIDVLQKIEDISSSKTENAMNKLAAMNKIVSGDKITVLSKHDPTKEGSRFVDWVKSIVKNLFINTKGQEVQKLAQKTLTPFKNFLEDYLQKENNTNVPASP